MSRFNREDSSECAARLQQIERSKDDREALSARFTCLQKDVREDEEIREICV